MNLSAGPSTVRLLFVCTGNMCRSAAADRLVSDWVARSGAPVSVRSAGTRARPGRPLHAWTERALQRHGVSAQGFASRHLSSDDVDWADLVLTMTADHREEVVGVSARGMPKVFTLLEAAGLSQTLRPDLLSGARPRGQVLADALRDARSRHARAHGAAFDIVDPIDGPTRLHVEVVDQIVAALEPLLGLLSRPTVSDHTLRMPRLPPVPRAR